MFTTNSIKENKPNTEFDLDFSKSEETLFKLEEDIKNNKNKYTIIRNHDNKIIKNITVLNDSCFQNTFPCLHDVVILFNDNTIEETMMNTLILYEIWKNLSFDITPKFLSHCKYEEKLYKNGNMELDNLKNLFTIEKDLFE